MLNYHVCIGDGCSLIFSPSSCIACRYFGIQDLFDIGSFLLQSQREDYRILTKAKVKIQVKKPQSSEKVTSIFFSISF